jgi:hypothetical protein
MSRFIDEHAAILKSIISPLYYFSVHFSLNNCWFDNTAYDPVSPWCFPVSCWKNSRGVYNIKRGTGVTAAGDEYPDFDALSDIPEYDPK